MSRRARITKEDLNELVTARDWCVRRDWPGLAGFYNELLGDLQRRRSLPADAYQQGEPDERDTRGDRGDRGR